MVPSHVAGRRQPTARVVATAVAILVVAVATGGCWGRKSNVASVTGVVTLDGKPVARATVGFQPRSGRPAYGGTDEQGHYKLFYDFRSAGAVVGTCDVTITTAYEDEEGRRQPERIPKKYFKPGALVVEVEPKANVFNFELTSSP
jgi:hypothetical protein